MAVFETWIESDLQKMIVPRALPGNAFCMDSGANLIGVSVMDGGEPATLSGTVAGKVVRSDGTTVPVTGGTLSGNKASIILPQRAYEVPGPIAIAVTLTSGSTVTTIGAVTGYVVRSQTDSIIDPGTILPTIDTLINQIETAIDSIPADYSQVIHSIAPSFSSSTAYSAGDMVWYPGEATNPGALYRFTSAHAAGDWTGSDATAAVFANELSALKSAVNDSLKTVSDFDGINLVAMFGGFKPNYYLDASGNEHYGTAWGVTNLIPVDSDEEYVYSGVTQTGGNARCFYYTDTGAVDLSSEFFIVVPGAKLNIPSIAKYVRFTVNQNAGDLATFTFEKATGTLDKRIDIVSGKADALTDLWESSLYDKNTNVSGYLDDTASIVTAAAWETTALIPVAHSVTYIYSGLTHTPSDRSKCFYYDVNKYPILASKFVPSTGANKITPPDGACYVRFVVNKNNGDTNTFDLKVCNPSSGTGTVLEVSADGSKPFKTINDAYQYAYAIQSAQNPVTILIYPGTYNEVLECTSAGGVYTWGAYVSFVGINKNNVIWRNDTGLYANSPLHTSNPGLIKGITFIATHDANSTFEETYADHTEPSQQNYGSYGLHIDDPTNGVTLAGDKFTTTVEDCIIISKQHAAIGIGLRVGQTLIVKNCDFYMEIPTALENAIDSKKGAFLFHRIMNNEPSLFQHLIIDKNNIYTNMGKVMYTYNDGGGIEVDAMRNMLWSDVNENSNSVINGATTMFTKKSFGNNVSALNKATIS